jgi:cell division transport system permease protein
MSGFDPQRWRPAPLLPEGGGTQALLFLVATLCFLACLTAVSVLAADRAASGWIGQLGGEATVIVRPKRGETPDAAAARAAEALAGVAGVSEARALEPRKAYDLIRPWLGDISDIEDLPVPRLVTVSLERKAPATAAALTQALRAADVDATVDDHSLWIRGIRRSADLARAFGAGVFLLIAAGAAATVAFATQAGLSARRDVVEVLHLSGAGDRYIAELFQRRFVRLAILGGLAGAAAATAVAAVLRLVGGPQGLTPALPIAWSDLAVVVACPLAAAVVAALAARLTALRLIRDME